MPVSITSTKSKDIPCFKGVIYGDPGVGKTSLARTAMGLGKVLIVSGESGLAPLAGYDIDVAEFKSSDDLAEIVAKLQSREWDHKVIYVDSLTEAGKLIDQRIFSIFAEHDEVTGLTSVPKSNNFNYYGQLSRDKTMFLRMIRDLPDRHVFFSALPKRWEDKNTGLEGVRPHFGEGSAAVELPGLFDFVFAYRWLEPPGADEPVRVLCTHTHDGWIAKARQRVDLPVLPPFIPEPNLADIVRRSTGAHQEKAV